MLFWVVVCALFFFSFEDGVSTGVVVADVSGRDEVLPLACFGFESLSSGMTGTIPLAFTYR